MFTQRMFEEIMLTYQTLVVFSLALKRKKQTFKVVSLNVRWDTRIPSSTFLSQKQRIPEILEKSRRLVDRNSSVEIPNPDVLLFQEVHETCLEAFQKFAENNCLTFRFGMYNSKKKLFFVTLTPHNIVRSSLKRTPKGFNCCLGTTVVKNGTEIEVFNVHLPLDASNCGERVAATKFVSDLASGTDQYVENPGFLDICFHQLRLWFLSFYHRSIISGNWNTLSESQRGAKTQISEARQRGMVDVSSSNPGSFFAFMDSAARSLVFSVILMNFSERILSVNIPVENVYVLLFLSLTACTVWKRLYNNCTVFDNCWNFWVYPTEVDRLQGPQKDLLLDRCAVSPGVRCSRFGTISEILETRQDPEKEGFPVSDHFSETSENTQNPEKEVFPVSDHLRIFFEGDVGLSFAGYVVRWIAKYFF